MYTTSNQSLITTSSSSPSPPSWDVFLSFRGADTRRNIISHLYLALDQAGIQTFIDDSALEKGQEISPGLLAAIEDSKIYVVVLSENYAQSSWCLDELVHILASKKTKNQVIPVFYYVDPSDVRHLKNNYATAFRKHEERSADGVIQKWKSALFEISKLSGFHLRKEANQNEAVTVQEIVSRVASQVSIKQLHLEENLYGIDSAVKEIYQKLRMESDDVRVIGICGMGGIGKTTTAKAFYNKYSNRFDISCFIEHVKQYSQGGSPQLQLLRQLLSKLRRRRDYEVSDVETGIRQLQNILSSNKALIILDDLDKLSHLEGLDRLSFSPGSRLVITTRDVNLLNQLKVDLSELEIYMVKKLEHKDSLELFSYHAFRKPMPPDDFKELSVRFVTYAEGLPLALKVLGASLRGRTDISFWKAKYKTLEKIPKNEIHKILRLSYDELDDETQKAMFLHIVFFFIGKNKAEAIDIFRSCDLFPEAGIPVLEERFLITINQNDKFEMHNLIQEMGREVSREESKHGNSRHMYLCQRNEYEGLEHLKETNKIEVLVLRTTEWANQQLTTNLFERLPNLKLLEIIGVPHIQGSFMNCFRELRCIRWHHCPWTQLPSDFNPQKLVSFDMQASKLQMLWEDVTLLGSLKRAEKLVFGWLGGYVMNLKQYYLPKNNIKLLTNLTSLNLAKCYDLKRLPEQLGDMKGLKMIDACSTAIEQLPDSIEQLINLTFLNLYGCKNLKRLPEQLGAMKGLEMIDASYTPIEQLPDSIVHLKALGSLSLIYCKKLRKLPEQFGNMKGLMWFDASHSGIEELPDSIGQLIKLTNLNLMFCERLTSLPDSICKLKLLQKLVVYNCSKLERLPEQLGEMISLESIHAFDTAIQEIPDSIGHLSRLKFLQVDNNKKLKDVPSSIWNLTSLVSLYLPCGDILTSYLPPDSVKDMKKLEFLSMKCDIRLWLPMILSLTSLKELELAGEGKSLSSKKGSMNLSKLSNLEDLTLDNWGSSYLELPPSLTYLRLSNNATVEQLPDLSNLEHLKRLDIKNCISLQSLPSLPLSLKELDLCNNATVEQLPDLSNLEHLEILKIKNCISLQSLPSLPLNLQSLSVVECTNLKDVPDLSMLIWSRIHRCSNLKSIDLKQSSLEGQLSFSAHLPNKEIPEWFDFKSSGSKISFNIPSSSSSSSVLGVKFLGIALWVVYKYNKPAYPPISGEIMAVITNKTEAIEENYPINVFVGDDEEEVQERSKVDCISRHIKSGDRIEVEFRISDPGKVLMCGAHIIIPETTSSISSLASGAPV